MNKKIHFLQIVTVLLLSLGINIGWAVQPPNPTSSDAKGNTAGGTDTLLNNTGSANTGFGRASLRANTIGVGNTASGWSSLTSNTAGSGNTATGVNSLFYNTGGSNNTASGYASLLSNTIGNNNTASGVGSLEFNTFGSDNTASGIGSMNTNTKGNDNAAFGYSALANNKTGNNNVSVGANSLFSSNIGNYNTVVGSEALKKLTAGNTNIAIGMNAGLNLTLGNNNIYIANAGIATESTTIRIGVPGHSRTFIGGIRGKTTGVANAVPVLIDANGQLGTANSSARFKKDIQDMNDSSHRLLELRPVTYHYKQASEDGSNPLEYGLIAEEVAKVYPDLVVYGADGKVETVQYQKLTPMLVNEVKRLNNVLQAEKVRNVALAQEINNLKLQMTTLQAQSERIEALTSRLSRIEANQTLGMVAK